MNPGKYRFQGGGGTKIFRSVRGHLTGGGGTTLKALAISCIPECLITCINTFSFRDECEELRSEFSKQTRDDIFKDRRMQIEMKSDEKERKKGIEDFYTHLWHADTKAKAIREEMETKERLQRDRECLEVIYFRPP